MVLAKPPLESNQNKLKFVVPTNVTLLIYLYMYYIYIYGVLLILMISVQFPLHEPYFDLTLIRVTHTKITCKHI